MLLIWGWDEPALQGPCSTFDNRIPKPTESEPGEHDFVAHKSLNWASGKTLKLSFLDTTLGLLFQNLMSSSLANSRSSHQVSDGIRPAEEVKI